MDKLSLLEQLCFSTTRIETHDANGLGYSGTGFLFCLKVDDKEIPLIVTNKHVINGMVEGVFRFTKSDDNDNPLYNQHHIFTFKGFEQMWIKHPDPKLICA